MNIKNDCRKATMLIEKKQWGSISLLQHLELSLHLLGCRECKIYKVQSRQLNRLLHKIFLRSTVGEQSLDQSVKDQLQRLINDELEK